MKEIGEFRRSILIDHLKARLGVCEIERA